MNKNLTMTLTLSATALFLAGCSSNIDAAKSASENITGDLSDIQEEFVDLQKEEQALQALFNETLEQDENFETLADNSSAVFENIKARTESIEELKGKQGELEEEFTALNDLEADGLPADLFEETKSQLDGSAKALDAFITHYSENLNQQSDYFQSLASEDASYETFTEGIRSINEQQETLYEKFTALDIAFSSLNETNQAFYDALNEDK